MHASCQKMFFIIVVCIFIPNIIIVQARTTDDVKDEEEETEYYTNSWAVRVLGGVEKAKQVARQLGFDSNIEASEGLPDFYLYRHPKYPEKMLQPEEELTRKLREESKIKWVEQQIALKLLPTIQFPSIPISKQILSMIFSRDDDSMEIAPSSNWTHSNARNSNRSCLRLNDEYWSRQYYIQDCRDRNSDKPPRDLAVVPVWTKHHLFGKNIKVLVIDDGVETDHPDLVGNYDPKLGLDIQDNDTEPDPVHSWWHKYSHGTRCAGVIGMKANNSLCGVGIAPLVTLGAVRLVGPKLISEFEIIKALLFKFNEVDIVSNSWSMRDTGKTMWFTGLLSLSAVKAGITKGRGGKGLIYVFACGTHKSFGDNCGREPLRNCIYTISVASCDSHGKITSFSERCASIMVTTYSGDGSLFRNSVISTDVGNGCTANHSGTSASAPMVSGAIALVLEANPTLTWRDVQHLLTWTSDAAPLQKNPPGTWIKNGAGFYVSHDFGFGLLNVNDLVETAKNFQSVPPLNICVAGAKLDKGYFHSGLNVNVKSDGCKGTPSEVMYLEHVQVTLSLTYPRRGDLQLELISPSGTVATLFEPRPFDSYALGIPAWTFESVMTWGENPMGIWTFRVIVKNQKSGVLGNVMKTMWWTFKNATGIMDATYPGDLKELYLIFYGTSEKGKPKHYKAGPRSYHGFHSPDRGN